MILYMTKKIIQNTANVKIHIGQLYWDARAVFYIKAKNWGEGSRGKRVEALWAEAQNQYLLILCFQTVELLMSLSPIHEEVCISLKRSILNSFGFKDNL